MRELMAELTAQHTGQPFARVLEDGERDRWFTPDEALEYGLIDFIHPATKRG
jgi:ATP-dependent Clp protease, protease subunit